MKYKYKYPYWLLSIWKWVIIIMEVVLFPIFARQGPPLGFSFVPGNLISDEMIEFWEGLFAFAFCVLTFVRTGSFLWMHWLNQPKNCFNEVPHCPSSCWSANRLAYLAARILRSRSFKVCTCTQFRFAAHFHFIEWWQIPAVTSLGVVWEHPVL